MPTSNNIFVARLTAPNYSFFQLNTFSVKRKNLSIPRLHHGFLNQKSV